MIYLVMCTVEELPDPATGTMPEPAPEVTGDFYVRLGMTIAAWQLVESTLVWIYSAAVGSKNRDAVAASFHTPTSFRTRVDMTNEAVLRADLSDTLKAEWAALYKRLIKKGKRRNAIAHSIVMFDPKRRPQSQLFLSPNVNDPSRFSGKFGNSETITGRELEQMMHVFGDLRRDMTLFQMRMPQLPASP
jgi:hypothetical protein